MSDGEAAVLKIFHVYRMRPYKMLFLDANLDARFAKAVGHLLDRGWIIRERHKHAFHLSSAGYKAMRSLAKAS
ncbi:MAG TPA: hypothetical protein VHV77_06470 [Pirellulales bacterium]|jgi:hypothetical protein|nr:hypothetical protein [Pirellulales bacterium]